MSYVTAIFIVLSATVLAAGASLLVDQLVLVETRRRHHEIGAQIFQQVGVMFAVLLAFVFSEVWGEYNTAAQAISGECGALHGAAMLADSLPGGAGRPVDDAIAAYLQVVVRTEWPVMAQRRQSSEAVGAFRTLLDTAARLPVTAPADVAIQSQMVTLLTEAHAFRETRTFQITQGLPTALWAVLVSLAAVLEAFVLFAGIDSPGRVLFAGAFAGCTVLVLVIVALLDYPFEGSLSLKNTDFLKTQGQVAALLAGR